jgi:predicted nucleic acid-binding Zn ribbon protein
MAEHNYDEQLAAAAEETTATAAQRVDILAEIGAKALPGLRGDPDFADLANKLDDADAHAEELVGRIARLREEKALFELKEKERLARCTCPQCGKVNSDESRFCEECGATVGVLPREFCKICGTMNQQGLKFCGECGTKLDEIPAT